MEFWPETRLSPWREDRLWELFHENSKISRSTSSPSDEQVLERMAELPESLCYVGYPAYRLPPRLAPLKLPLARTLQGRRTARHLTRCRLTFRQVATLLHYAYGVTCHNPGTGFPRPLRVVPSGGALYPLELFFYSKDIEGHPAGLYHYSPPANHVRLLRRGDETERITEALSYQHLGKGAALLIFITALFERSTFKYGERGYRFTLLEAGHVAQNLNLVAHALGFASVNLGGYFDHAVDEWLGLDGVTSSTIYIFALGRGAKNHPSKKSSMRPRS